MYPLSSKQKALRFSPFSQAGLKRWSPLILDQPSCSTLRAALVFTFHGDLRSVCSKPSAALGASKEAQWELTPWPSRWSSGWGRKSHRHPWHSLRTRVRDCSQDAPRTNTHTPKQQPPPTQTHTDTRAESHTTWHDHKECERVESQDTYRHPTTPSQQR